MAKNPLDLAGALADTSDLTPFEGRDVVRTGIEIPNAAGGLQAAMKVDPREFEHGEEAFVVLHVVCRKVRFDEVSPDDDDTPLERVHVFKATGAAFLDDDKVREALTAQKARIDAAIREATGAFNLDDALAAQDDDDNDPTQEVDPGTAGERGAAMAKMQTMTRAQLHEVGDRVGVSTKSSRDKGQAVERLLDRADVPKLLAVLDEYAPTGDGGDGATS